MFEIDEKNPLSTKLTFLIDEGRHYKIRSYKIVGVKSFEIEELKESILFLVMKHQNIKLIPFQKQLELSMVIADILIQM